eukprot:1165452-Pyramimonas_sp.AAC.1
MQKGSDISGAARCAGYAQCRCAGERSRAKVGGGDHESGARGGQRGHSEGAAFAPSIDASVACSQMD